MKVSSPDKLLFPADETNDNGITKAEVVAHYESVAPIMLDFLRGRPLTLQRFPSGIDAKGFMQKNAAKHFPDSIRRLPVPKRGGGETVYPVVDQADDIAYLANQNTITFHMWTSSADRPGQPDWMVIDLDPEGGDTDGARKATTAVAEILDRFEVSSTILATGSKGFHLWVPLDGAAGFDDVSQVSRAIAGLAVAENPDDLTTEFLKKNRHGRVFVDWLRNGPTATVVVPFSLRPRPSAPVATLLARSELSATAPDAWNIANLGSRLQTTPVASFPAEPQALPVAEIIDAACAADVDLETPHDRFGRSTYLNTGQSPQSRFQLCWRAT